MPVVYLTQLFMTLRFSCQLACLLYHLLLQNVNEVISNRAIELLHGTLGTKKPVRVINTYQYHYSVT